jgi:hypothetical protein
MNLFFQFFSNDRNAMGSLESDHKGAFTIAVLTQGLKKTVYLCFLSLNFYD